MTEARFPGSIRLVEAAAPGTPPTGTVYVYVKADGKLYFKDDAGTETACGGGVGTGDLLSTNNLSDLANAATARTNLSLGNVTNESKATMFTNPAFTGTVTIPDAALAIADTSGLQTALDAKEALSCIARGTGAAVAVNSTSVTQMASATNTVAAGDTYSFYLSGYVLNNSGANATYTVRVTIGATTFDLAFNAATATSASNVSYVRVFAAVAVISSSSIACTINVRTGVAAAVATIQNDVLAQDRSIIRTSTNNETGSKTIGIGLVSSTNTATQTFTRTRAEIYKGAAI